MREVMLGLGESWLNLRDDVFAPRLVSCSKGDKPMAESFEQEITAHEEQLAFTQRNDAEWGAH